MSFFDAHHERLQAAVEACLTRSYWTPFVESPSRRLHAEGAKEAGLRDFEAVLDEAFPIDHPGELGLGAEVSPWTGEALGVRYPMLSGASAAELADAALPALAAAGPRVRVGVCMEILDRLSRDVFFNAHATMHTAGQPFMMAFAGSGANSLDRGLEATAMAWWAMQTVPSSSTFARRFGRGEPVVIDKRYRLVPRGVTVVFSCATYPAWNAYPAIMASLATGNPVVLKPHPTGVLPMARAAKIARRVLVEAGLPADALVLAVDTPDRLVGLELVNAPEVATVDFTGSPAFGAVLEAMQPRIKVYSETAGCNAVVLESTDDLDRTLAAVSHSLCCFSSQMCTAAQNIFVPASGVRTPAGRVDADEVEARLVARTREWLSDPTRAPAVAGTIQDPRTLDAVHRFDDVLLEPERLTYEDTPSARACSPVIVRGGGELHRQEHFGPIGFCIRVPDADEGLRQAAQDARERGSIASYLYSTDPGFQERAQDAFVRAGASLGINLHRQLPINYAAAYSDFHVTGLNPAGTASLTDLAFVADRYRVVQTKTERPQES